MLLVGMLDSPYVRRAAVTGTLLGLPFEHRSVSVFRHVDAFRAINPLVKAPTLVCPDGTTITDSNLIILHLEDVAGRSLRPVDPAARRHDLALTGIAIVAADKAVGIEYELKRPEAQRHGPWLDRIRGQLHAALDLLDEAAAAGRLGPPEALGPAAVAAAIAWSFCRFTIPDHADETGWPALARLADGCETTDAFRLWPIDRE